MAARGGAPFEQHAAIIDGADGAAARRCARGLLTLAHPSARDCIWLNHDFVSVPPSSADRTSCRAEISVRLFLPACRNFRLPSSARSTTSLEPRGTSKRAARAVLSSAIDNMKRVSLAALRRHAVARSLFGPIPLAAAIDALGFVQADPIRAPARAQDLTLRHRVDAYRAGDLERAYATLAIEEDAFVNYGFLPRSHSALMHPRVPRRRLGPAAQRRADALVGFVRAHGEAHPRDVDAHFAHGAVRNYWGGSSNATTHLLDALHYRGVLRVTRRDNGVRVYGVRGASEPRVDGAARAARLDALVDIVVRKYAPLPSASLASLVRRLRYGAPQWHTGLPSALVRAHLRLARARVDGVDWYWPEGEDPTTFDVEPNVRFLAPFDPVVWDRARFELLWDWPYRFEAYTPLARRRLGYYALPLLWRERVVGWVNASVHERELHVSLGYVEGRAPRERAFAVALDAEVARMRAFLGL